MGRRAKHLTLQKKEEASRKRVADYKRTQKGRTTCNKNNRAAYARHTTRHMPPSSSSSLELPEPLIIQYYYPLRATYLFKQAHGGVCSIALPDLGIWSAPYQPVTNCILNGDCNLLDLLHSLNGWNLAQVERTGAERYQEAAEVGANTEMTKTMRKEIETRLAQWSAQHEAFQKLEGSELDTAVGDVALNWGAKQVFCLEDEFQTRIQGLDAYLGAYKAKQLAWQCIAIIE